MTKLKTVWICASCGTKQMKWAGQCSGCLEWNTLHEEVEEQAAPPRYAKIRKTLSRPVPLSEVPKESTPRIATEMVECDRLLGGGIVPGALTLIGGDPGIGKSTFTMQLASALAKQGKTILYVCGEESVEQTSLRAHRLGIQHPRLFLYNETHLPLIKNQIAALKPDIVVIDSIQVVYKSDLSSAPGTVSQVREAASECMHLAKSENISIFLIGHVTKAGEIAGPRVLEHLVDTVLYFEGEKQHDYRLIRVVKNRFGPTDEIAMFQMEAQGLVPISNPSERFLNERKKDVVGSVMIPTVEGSRAFLVEVQALVTETAYSTPTRRSTGVDPNRLSLLLAVLEKRMGYPMHRCDVFVSIAGGLRVNEPAIDLGIVLAVASSLRNRVVDPETTLMGEVGLGGEVRSVPRLEARIKEAELMGFHRCYVPSRHRSLPGLIQKKDGIRFRGVEMVEEAIHDLLD